MKKITVAIAVLSLSCTAEDPVSVSHTNNVNVPVSLLFEHDGVKVYRFADGGQYHYYADARGKTSSIRCAGDKCRARKDDSIETVGE